MKKYTEEEILELGRAAIKRMGIKVYVIIYTHKHGMDCSVYGGMSPAQASALALMISRVENWHHEDRIKFQGCENFDDQMDVFHQVEKEISYGETIEILERTVQ